MRKAKPPLTAKQVGRDQTRHLARCIALHGMPLPDALAQAYLRGIVQVTDAQ